MLKLIFWPFALIWSLAELLLKLTGRLVAASLGLALLLAGILLTATLVGAVAEIPLMAAGLLLLVRSLF